MSLVKKIVKGVKKVAKGAFKLVKKYWKPILMAAAIVFTAGIATVGFAGFSTAMGAGGVGGFFSAVGATMQAGVAAITGTLGLSAGVTAETAGGVFAESAIFAGVEAGSGLTLLNGAAAQSLGLATSTKTAVAGDAFLPAAQGAGGSVAGDAVLPAAQGGSEALSTASKAGSIAPESMAPSLAPGVPPGAAPQGGGLAGWLNSTSGRLATGFGSMAAQGYMAGARQEDQQEWENEHKSFGGQDWNGNAAGTDTPFDEYREDNPDPNENTAWAQFQQMRRDRYSGDDNEQRLARNGRGQGGAGLAGVAYNRTKGAPGYA